MKSLSIPALAVALITASTAPSAAEAFSISFRWCSGSSEITLKGVPKGTTTLEASMLDYMARGYDHGGGKVAWKGEKQIPCGAIKNYRPPSPPPPQVHEYEWTVDALDASGKVLGTAKAVRKYPEK